MMLTEEEAKTKRCQEGYAASDGVTDGESVYRQTMVPAPSSGISFSGAAAAVAVVSTFATAPMHCIGSACMAWRWTRRGDRQKNQAEHVNEQKMYGYCGKAGKP